MGRSKAYDDLGGGRRGDPAKRDVQRLLKGKVEVGYDKFLDNRRFIQGIERLNLLMHFEDFLDNRVGLLKSRGVYEIEVDGKKMSLENLNGNIDVDVRREINRALLFQYQEAKHENFIYDPFANQ